MMGVTLGLGLGVTHRQSEWFNSGAYADLAAIADFSNNQYALPAIRGPVSRQSEGTGFALSGSVVVTGDQHAIALGGAAVRWLYPLVGLVNGALYQITVPVHAVSGTGNVTIDIIDFPAQTVTPVAGTPIVLYMTPGRNFDSTYRFVDIVTASGLAVTVGTPVLQEVVLTRNAVALGANLAPGTGTNRSIGTGTATYTGGTLTLIGTNGSNTGAYEFPLVTQAGREYRITFTVAGASTFCGLWDQANQGAVIGGTAATRAAGFHTIEFTATDADSYLVFGNTSAGGTSTITGITAQELPAIGSYPKRSATFAEWFAFTAASDTARSYVDAAGVWRTAAYGVTNYFRNSAMLGAAIGSPGTLPNNAAIGFSAVGLSRQVVGVGVTAAGLPYTDLRISGTVTTSGNVSFSWEVNPNTIVASNGQTWTLSTYIEYISGSGLVAPSLGIDEYANGAVFVKANQVNGLATNGRISYTVTLTGGGTVTGANPFLRWVVTTGQVVDQVVRIYGGQMEPGPVASPVTLTYGSAAIGGVNAPRFDFRNSKRQFRLEDARTNSIRNNSMSGAVAGSPGTAPTNWTASAQTGYAWQLAATGTEFGLPYIDYRLSGTDASLRANNIIFDTSTGIVAATGDTWSHSLFARVVAGSLTGVTTTLQMDENTSVGGFVANGNTTITTTSAITRYSFTRTLSGGATVARVQPFMRFTTGAGATVDLTIRIYAPQMELGAFASDPILTSGATAVTRAIETARFSPLLEAIMQRAAASVVVRGQMDAPMGVTGGGVLNARIVGGGNNVLVLCRNAQDSQQVATYQGTSLGAGGANPILSTPWGVGLALDSSGRSLAKGGSSVVSDTQAKSTYDLSTVYLNRDNSGSGVNFANYDFVGISPERLSNATLQALAVPA